jgi:hypothetical protein
MHQYLLTVQQLLEWKIAVKMSEDELMMCHGVRTRRGRCKGGNKPFLGEEINLYDMRTLFN